MWETVRIVRKIRPRIVVWENVKNVLSKKHRHNFDKYLSEMEKLGYKNYYQVLNAKDYGVPQNRERVFTISLLKSKIVYDAYNSNVRKDQNTIGTLTTHCGMAHIRTGWKIIESEPEFHFPEPQPLTVRLKDILEDEVDEKYYLSDKAIEGFKKHNANHEAKGTGFLWKIRDKEGVASCLRANGALAPTDNTVSVVREGGIFDTDKSTHQAGSIYNTDGLSPTLDTMQGGYRQPMVTIAASRGRGEHNEQQLEFNKTGTTNTLTSVQKDNLVVESKLPGAYGRDFGSKGKVQTGDTVSTLQAAMGNGGGNVPLVNNDVRIRRLTPRETWRLMSFSDEDFDKAAATNSDTQLYRQAGNSIVVKVLEGIIKQLKEIL